jgi:hypothetical protein
MTIRSQRKSLDTGISESIGFMLIFTIIIAGIGLVTLYGYPILMQQQTSADEKIMEKNMIVLQNDIKSLTYKTVPYKETSLKIGGGTLFVYRAGTSGGTTLHISHTGSPTTGGPNLDTDYDLGELRYESIDSQTDVSLQNGAVITRPRILPGSAMIAEPRWIVDVDPVASKTTMVISLIKITGNENYSRAGIGTVRMRLIGDPIVTTYNPGIVTVSVPAGQNYKTAWENYFNNALNMGTGPYTLTVDKLVVKEYEVKIDGI